MSTLQYGDKVTVAHGGSNIGDKSGITGLEAYVGEGKVVHGPAGGTVQIEFRNYGTNYEPTRIWCFVDKVTKIDPLGKHTYKVGDVLLWTGEGPRSTEYRIDKIRNGDERYDISWERDDRFGVYGRGTNNDFRLNTEKFTLKPEPKKVSAKQQKINDLNALYLDLLGKRNEFEFNDLRYKVLNNTCRDVDALVQALREED
jgi:hypothetical protein